MSAKTHPLAGEQRKPTKRYEITTNDASACVWQFIAAFKAANPSIGTFNQTFWDGSTMKITIRNAPSKSVAKRLAAYRKRAAKEAES